MKRYADGVDARLEEILSPDGHEDGPLLRAMRYAVLSPGKRVRPALCMASAFAVGADSLDALDAGCAVELVHCFSLIHDDLPAIDNDTLRRGKPTCHIEFGEALAILAGDALFSMAFEVLADSAPCERAGLEAIRILASSSGLGGLVGGEVADILAEGKPTTEDQIRNIHERKTGALIRAACAIGGIFGKGDKRQVEALTEFGARAGLAFQISDDLLDELSTSDAIGKTAGMDRERRKATYPSRFGVAESKRLAEDAAHRALGCLEGFDGRADDLRVFAQFVVDRLR